MEQFNVRVQEALNFLNENREEWEPRYNGYVESMNSHKDTAIECFEQFKSQKPFSYYITTSELKDSVNVFNFSMRFAGQEIATVKVYGKNARINSGDITIFTTGHDESNKKYFGCEIRLEQGTKWNDSIASKFRAFFNSVDKTQARFIEHALESVLITELSKKQGNGKYIVGIQPVRIEDKIPYSFKTPFKASTDELGYSGRNGGCVDILAHYNENLTVIELKANHDSSESPEKAMRQAIAYATFLHQLLRSDIAKGQDWYRFLEYKKVLSDNLTINVVVAMPNHESGSALNDKSFAREEISMGGGDKLVLHYMYLTVDDEGNVTGIDSSL